MKNKILIVMLSAFMAVWVLFGCTSEPANNSSETATAPSANTDATDEVVTEPLVATPDQSGAIVSAIEGYNANSAAQSGTVDSNSVVLPYSITDTSLKITAMGGYTGDFVEDSSDEKVTGVYALVVQNTSDLPLKVAKIVITDTDGNDYIFKLSTLPAGASAIVMESERKAYSPEISISEINASETFLSSLSLNEESISISFDGENLKLKNISDSDFSAVYVRYKNYTAGNIYLGGITYSANFDNVKAGEEYTYPTSHMNMDTSCILMVETLD